MIKLIAIGNRLMSDDGIAIAVAENLLNKFKDLNIEIIIAETDCQTYFNLLNNNDFVIILDALYTGAEPGSIDVFSLDDVLKSSNAINTQHDMSIIDFMKIYNRKLKGYMIGIEVEKVGFGDELSSILKEKFYNICYKVEQIITNIISEELSNA